MPTQIERTGHSDDVWLFMKYLPNEPSPDSYDDVPLAALLPAFTLSTLKTALLIAFQISLPFVILFTAAWLLKKMISYTRHPVAHVPGCR